MPYLGDDFTAAIGYGGLWNPLRSKEVHELLEIAVKCGIECNPELFKYIFERVYSAPMASLNIATVKTRKEE